MNETAMSAPELNIVAVQRRFRIVRIPCVNNEYPDRFMVIDNFSWHPPVLFASEADAKKHISVKLWGARMPRSVESSCDVHAEQVPVELAQEPNALENVILR